MSSPPVLTAEDLLEIHEVGYRHELVRGVLRRTSAGAPLHGLVAARVIRHLASFVEDRGLGAGLVSTRLVWIVDPKAKRVTVYRGPRDVVVLGPADTLDGGEVLPGYTVAVAALFPSPVR